jgi:hypothetical protein
VTAPKSPQIPPVFQAGDVILVSGQGIVDLVFLISHGIRGAQRQCYPTARFEEYKRIFKQAWEFQPAMTMSPTRLGDVATGPVLRQSRGDEPEYISTAEAALLSGYTRRHVQRLARDSGLGGRVGRVWMLDRVGFIAHLSATRGDTDDRAAA